MSCERYERDLALYVESDLPAEAVGVLERHLGECRRCQAFLRSLEDSQRRLKSLAAEPLDDAALLGLRRRVLSAVSHARQPSGASRPWLWAAAAGFLILAATLGITRSWRRHPPRAPGIVSVPRQQPKAAQPLPLTADLSPRAERQRSTPERVRPVSRDVGLGPAQPATPLSSEEADQLARAIVVVSRIERVSEAAAGAATSAPAAEVVKLATADPEIVIYWQIDSNGG